MKTAKQLIVLVFLALCALTACKNDKKAEAAALAAQAARTADSLAAVEAADLETKRAEEAAAALAATTAAAEAKANAGKKGGKKNVPAVKPPVKTPAKPAVKPAPKPKPKPKPAPTKTPDPTSDTKGSNTGAIVSGGDKQLGDASNVVQRPGRDNVLTISEVKPSYPGGDGAMMKFLSKNIKYPSQAKDDGVKGTVFVKFVVEKDGSVDDVVVSKGVHPLLDAEAMRVVKAMPKWAAGKQAGQPVATQYTLPVKFQLVE